MFINYNFQETALRMDYVSCLYLELLLFLMITTVHATGLVGALSPLCPSLGNQTWQWKTPYTLW